MAIEPTFTHQSINAHLLLHALQRQTPTACPKKRTSLFAPQPPRWQRYSGTRLCFKL